jgi:hypothetical protein
MTLNGIEGSVQSYFNEAMFEEISYQTSAINAEVSAGGVRANMIRRTGTSKGRCSSRREREPRQQRGRCEVRPGRARRPQQGLGLQRLRRRPDQEDKLWFFALPRLRYQHIANSFYKNGDQTIDDATSERRRAATYQLNSKNKVAAS